MLPPGVVARHVEDPVTVDFKCIARKAGNPMIVEALKEKGCLKAIFEGA